jgi:hypothetical protein
VSDPSQGPGWCLASNGEGIHLGKSLGLHPRTQSVTSNSMRSRPAVQPGQLGITIDRESVPDMVAIGAGVIIDRLGLSALMGFGFRRHLNVTLCPRRSGGGGRYFGLERTSVALAALMSRWWC